jgi:TolB protein
MRHLRTFAGLLVSVVAAACAGGQAGARSASRASAGTIAYASFAPQNTDIFIADSVGGHARPLLADAALDYNASLSADGVWAVFTSERRGNADIYRAHHDGTHLEQLTTDAAFDDQAALSPDGRTLAFVSSRSGQADIWLLDLKNHVLRNLTNDPAGDFRPEWSPDGTKIAFSSDRVSTHPRSGFVRSQSTELFVIGRDGQGLRRVTSGNAYVGSPVWSRDGAHLLAYVAPIDQVQNIVTARRLHGTTQIAVIDAMTGTQDVRTSGPGEKWSPRWLANGGIGYVSGGATAGLEFVSVTPGPRGEFGSPHWSADGKVMVFHREVASGWPPHTSANSRDPRYRLVRTGVFASYSPDGTQLVENDGTAGIMHNDIYIMNTDWSNRHVLVGDSVASSLAPAWSPCGDRIAFARGRFFPATLGKSAAVIAVVQSDGSGLTALTDSGGNAGFPGWSPDGRSLVYRVVTANRSALMIVDVSSHAIRRLTDSTGNDNSPAWSPRGDLIAFTSRRPGDDDYEMYTIRPDGTELRRITKGHGNMSHPAWSPDGTWLAFTGSSGGFKDEAALHPYNPQPYGEISVMRPDGSEMHALTDNQFEDGTPTWVPRTPRMKTSCP